MAQFADRVKVSNTTTASAGSATTLTLGSAEAGYQAVPSSLDGETIRYVIEEGNTWEIGTGTYTHSGTTLSRSVTSSSNSNNAIAVTSSSKVFITPVVDDLQFVQVYSSTSDLPSASDNHGRITHVHGDGAMYFAHGGNWIKLANASDAISLTDLSVTQNAASGSGALTYNSATGAFSYTPPASTSASGGTLDPIKETETVVSASTQSAFNVTHAVGNIAVYLNGSRLSDADWNSNSGGTTVTLTAPAVQNDIVTVVEYGAPFAAPYSSAIYTVGSSSEINANRDVLTADYTQGKEAVYVNGVKYLSSTDYSTNTGGTAITFTPALSAGDIVELVEHGALADAASAFTDLTDTPSSLGSAGQVAQVNSAGNALEFVDISAGASVYATADLLPLTGNSAGDMAYVTATNRFYINNGSGWYSVSLVNTNPNITSVQDGSSGTTPFTLTTDGTATVITITASDPEEVPLTYGYSVTSGSLTNGGGTTATVTQGTGSNSNKFTVTPSTNIAYGGTFTLTFTASDGINQAQSANVFSLNFVTQVTDSKYTTLLAQAVGANNGTNDTVTDSHSSSSPHTVTYPGTEISTGTFSPYRSGGYSVLFGNSNKFTSGMTAIGTSNYTIETWINWSSVTGNSWIFEGRYDGHAGNYLGSGGIGLRLNTNGQVQAFAGTTSYTGTTVLSTDTWYHIMVVRSGTGTNEFKVYLNGSLEVQGTDASSKTGTWFRVGGSYLGGNNPTGYIRDLRISTTARSTTTPTEPVEADSDTIWLGCSLPYFADASSSNNSITLEGAPETRPFTPYDYSEYDAADNGGSVYFRGAAAGKADHINVSSSNDFELGTGDFTIEGWLYPLTAVGDSGKPRVFMLKKASSATSIFEIILNSDGTLRGGSGNLDSTTNFVNSWNHFAFVRNSGTLKLYVNGAEERSASDTTSYSPGSPNPVLGAYYNGTIARYKGYVSDFRITKSAVYTSSFDAPTAPLASTNSVLHLKGTDASIIDKSGSDDFRLEGNAKCTTTAVVYNSNTVSSKSMYFDGTGDYINANSNIQDAIGTQEYTAEAWIYCTSIANRSIFGSGTTDAADEFGLYLLSNGQIYHDIGGGYDYVQSSSSITVNTWHHLAVTRTSSRIDIWLDGTSVGATTNTNIAGIDISGNSDFKIGHGRLGYWSGYIQDARLRIGRAEYTSTFTPPTAELEG